MKKEIIIITAGLLSAVLIAAAFLGVFLISPQKQIKKARSSLTVINTPSTIKDEDCVYFLRTASSDCILIQSKGHFALVDCGEDTDNPRGFDGLDLQGFEQEILSFLKKTASGEDGKVRLDFVLGTHAHSDHIGGFDTVISDTDVEVGRAYLKEYNEEIISAHEVNDWDNKEVYEQMKNALEEKNVPIISDITETEFTLGNLNIKLFNTEPEQGSGPVGENDNAIGVLVEKNGKKVFLAADIDNKSGDEERLAPEIGKVDVLKVGHHSYSGSTTSSWLRTLSPEVCVITNNYESTDKRTLRRIERICHAPLLITGSENGVAVIFGEDSLTYCRNIYNPV